MLLKDYTVYYLTLDVLFLLAFLFIWFMFVSLDYLLIVLIKKIYKKYVVYLNIFSSFY
jgi:hypothetical protein